MSEVKDNDCSQKDTVCIHAKRWETSEMNFGILKADIRENMQEIKKINNRTCNNESLIHKNMTKQTEHSKLIQQMVYIGIGAIAFFLGITAKN